ncbi:MAG: 50S ribosomal protein L22 [Candidatus Methanofastidiosa archaeon]|nr:50S ribosomal protein L22 [Candidatus Methanofastidiosa archaeon]
MSNYSCYKKLDDTKTAKIFGRHINISPKHAVEISREIKGMKLLDAKKYLEEVIEKKKAVAFRRYNTKVGHKRGLVGWDAGRYPVKASKNFIKLLNELQANAEYKGLDSNNLRIIHASSYKGRIIPGWIPRAYGRASPYNHVLINVELIVEER